MRGKRFTPSQNAISGDVEVSGNLTISGDVVVGGNISISGSGEANTASNLGSGEGTFASKVGVDLRFKSLVPQGTVGITSDGNQIYISASSPPFNHASQHEDGGDDEIIVDDLIGELADPQKVMVRQNSGANIGAQPRLNFIEGDNITISITEDVVNNEIDIEISGSAGGGSGDITNAENTGSGQGVFLEKSGTNLVFRSLSGSGGTIVSSGSNGAIIISSSVEGGGSGESNTASNVGGGTGLFAQKDGIDLQFKSLLVSGNLSIDSNSAEVSLSSSYATGENVGSGIEIFSGSTSGNLDFRTLSGSGGTSVSQNGDLVVISSSIPVIPDPGEDNTASNIGTGEGLFAQKDGVDLEFKSLNVSGNLSITSNASEVNISSSYATGENTGSGQGVFLESVNGNLLFRTLIGEGGTNISSGSNGAIVVSSALGGGSGEVNTAANIGSGEGLFSGKDGITINLRSLVGSGSTSILSGSDVVAISSSYATGENVGSGEGVFSGSSLGNLDFKSLSGSGGVSVFLEGANTIVISSSVPIIPDPGEDNTASNIGTGTGLFAQKDGVDLEFKSLNVSGNLSITSNDAEINLSSSYATAESLGGGTSIVAGFSNGDIDLRSVLVSGNLAIDSNSTEISLSSSYATGENVGGEIEIFSGSLNGNFDFRTLSGSGGTVVSQVGDLVVISSSISGPGEGSGESNTASNLGDGEGIFAQKDGIDLQFRSISGAGTVTVTSGANNTIIISGSGGGISSITFPTLRALHIQDQVAAETPGGTASAGWNDRPLTTVLRNEIAGASFTSGSYEIVLPSGTYIVSANAPAFKCDNHRLRFRSSTNVNFLLGPNSYSYSTENPQTHAFMHGQINVTASTTFRLQHYLQNPPGAELAAYAFGSENADGDVGVFADIIIYQQNTGSYTSGGGSEVTASNLGDGEGFYLDTSGSTLQFRSLSGSGGISVISGANNTVVVSGALTEVQNEVQTARLSASNLTSHLQNIVGFMGSAGSIIDGYYYSPGNSSFATSTAAGSLGRIELMPYYTPYPLRIREIGVQVSTQIANSVVKILIYDTGADGWPNNKLFESGIINTGTANWRPETGSVDFTYQPGMLYWVGVWHGGGATLRSAPLTSMPLLARNQTAPTSNTTMLSLIRRAFTFNSSSDAAPNPFGIFTGSWLQANTTCPLVSFQATGSYPPL